MARKMHCISIKQGRIAKKGDRLFLFCEGKGVQSPVDALQRNRGVI